MSKRATLDDVRRLVEKWKDRFGFGSYGYRVDVLPKKDGKGVWAKSVWLHDDDFFEIRIHEGLLLEEQAEALVLHELTHGLLSYAEAGNEESVCNRLPRLLLGEDTQTPNIWALVRCGRVKWGAKHFIDLDASTSLVDPLVMAAVPLLVDGLPPREQDLVNAVYWEGVSLMEVARRLGVSRRTAGRLHRQAMGHLRVLVEELEDAVDG